MSRSWSGFEHGSRRHGRKKRNRHNHDESEEDDAEIHSLPFNRLPRISTLLIFTFTVILTREVLRYSSGLFNRIRPYPEPTGCARAINLEVTILILIHPHVGMHVLVMFLFLPKQTDLRQFVMFCRCFTFFRFPLLQFLTFQHTNKLIFLAGTPHWACGARLLSYGRQHAVEASTISRAELTRCCVKPTSESRIWKGWRFRPVLIVGCVQEESMEGEKRNRSGEVEWKCARYTVNRSQPSRPP